MKTSQYSPPTDGGSGVWKVLGTTQWGAMFNGKRIWAEPRRYWERTCLCYQCPIGMRGHGAWKINSEVPFQNEDEALRALWRAQEGKS